jgi:hypothetical protein
VGSGIRRSLTYSLIGGVVLLAVDAAFNVEDLRGPGLLPYLASAFVGCIVGWMYDLGTRMSETTAESIRKMSELSHILEFQRPPLRMLVTAKAHAATIGLLLRESIGEQYRTIALVDPNRYLSFLKQALHSSHQFNGIMRNTIVWFRDNAEGPGYMQDLARRGMREKIRVFVIDDDKAKAMEEELADAQLMAFYWQQSGSVASYWIRVSDLLTNYRDLAVPDDCVLFDSELLIRYDAPRQTVFFDIADEHGLERRIFDKLRVQRQNESDRPFVEIRRTAAVPPAPRSAGAGG